MRLTPLQQLTDALVHGDARGPGGDPSEPGGRSTMELRDYLAIGQRWLWLFALASAVAAVGSWVGSRFMHNVLWLNFFASRRMEVMKEAFKPAVRFIVTDTQMAGYPSEVAAVDAHRDEARLPDEVHPELRTMFPWNQRVVFRAGRYMVHEVDHTTTPRLPSP